jgi:BirA family biotin operon repressor/biotin-[acetyl-CoA-carboxylase] ligase
MAIIESLDPDKIQANLKTKRIGRKVLLFDCTSSTNDIAAEYAKKNIDNEGLAIFAEQQTAGRGRAGTKWHSSYAESILCSILLTDCSLSNELLSLTFAVAVTDAIGKPGRHEAKIKWPNDIILNGKKVAGILLEARPGKSNSSYIAGIGINCHQKKHSFPLELQANATSIDLETGTVCDRISLARRLLTCLDHWLELAKKDREKIINEWRNLSIQLGHRVTLSYNGRIFAGNCIGIDPEKGLILQLDSGSVRMFDAAHTTIVK